jgi:hypothetical protein
MRSLLIGASLVCLLAVSAAGQDSAAHGAGKSEDSTPASPAQGNTGSSGGTPSEPICLLIESAAAANGLPFEFFARVIWQESRFQPNAVGPMTRSGDRARGIAQFMPRTAVERGLLDPLDPVQALPKSAEFLKELREEFGNLGLAAAAYNAGPQRVRDWLAGSGGLPAETRYYVQAITGRPADDWKDLGKRGDLKMTAQASCRELVALLKQAPNVFVEELEQRVRAGAARPWGVELSAGFSRAHVLAAYSTLEAKYRDTLAGADALILRSKFRSRGTRDFYQVRVGADTRGQAEKLCARLKAAGAACFVLRNSRGTPEAI